MLLLNHILLITQGLDTDKYSKWEVLPSCYSELPDCSCMYFLTEQSELLVFAALIFFFVGFFVFFFNPAPCIRAHSMYLYVIVFKISFI